ncbi:unnamed protein product [Lactuca virosa]|uniref:F-box domain-containing protein n=1 Tax=Lactuca virosa TaxID=75947 RepID=A0AAU9PIF5_9ASTR|nr:unnamed protein product [Lactuca virosa]
MGADMKGIKDRMDRILQIASERELRKQRDSNMRVLSMDTSNMTGDELQVILAMKDELQAMIRKSKRLTMSEYRGQEQHEIEDIGDMVDHISNLPDCILHQILSCMPTVEAVKTCILSTRWKNLWASVPNLDFDDAKLFSIEVDNWRQCDATSFKNFVERVLALQDASNLKKFHLTYVELDLCLVKVDPSMIPQSMFHNTSLVSLKLRMDCVIELPSHVSFPCVKILHLSLVAFPNADSTEKLFSGCPSLEALVLSDCKWMNLTDIVISSSTLKSLTIANRSTYKLWLWCDLSFKIKIDAVNLQFFQYFGYPSIFS